MRYFHVTDHAESIIAHGFQDGSGSYGLAHSTLSGVFVSDEILTINEGAAGSDVLAVDLPDDLDLRRHELVEARKGYREWCVPAVVLNRGQVRRLTEAEVDAVMYGVASSVRADSLRTEGVVDSA